MKINSMRHQAVIEPHLIRYFCDQCGFEQWDHQVIPMIRCECDKFAEHEEWEG